MAKRRIRITIDKLIFLCISTTIIVTTISLSKYRTSIATGSNTKVAFPMINLSTSTLNVPVIPTEEKTYIFTVDNNKDEKKTEVTMEYTLQIKTLSNLPLEFELYTYENGIVGEENLLAGNGNTTQTRQIPFIENTSHTYQLKIKWRTEEIGYEYNQVADYIQIILNSNQVD